MASSDFSFRGGGSVLHPNHITRYEYPCLLGHSQSQLILQIPKFAAQRSRPQGGAFWDLTHLTITPSGRDPPTRAQFRHWLVAENGNDKISRNPLGRAMRRVTGYQGNTLLQAGKFKLQGRLVYIVKRTTMLPLGNGDEGIYRKDEETYDIPCEQWRALKPPGDNHDSWWARLYDLFNGYPDRAYFHAKHQMDNVLGISAPLVKWVPRLDVEKGYGLKIHYDKVQLDSEECLICQNKWYVESDFPCTLKCGHLVCFECVIGLVDGNKPTDLFDGEEDQGSTKFWRCPDCRDRNFCHKLHHLNLRHDEIPWWRWYVAHLMLEKFTGPEWKTYLEKASGDGDAFIPPFQKPDPKDVPINQLDLTPLEDLAVTWVRFDQAISFMQNVVLYITSIQPWGYALDNPHTTDEAALLVKCLQRELHRLGKTKQRFNTKDLIAHMHEVGAKAFTPVVVEEKQARLGNPIFPAGYEEYRHFVCEWTARGCFWSKQTAVDVTYCVGLMMKNKGAWWDGEPKFPPAP